MRTITDFCAGWRFAKTAEVPAALPENWEAVTLPHTWNAVDGQDGGNDYWRGTAMYAKAFARPALEENGRTVLEFLGAAMTADVTLNGQHLAHHEGGFSTFCVDITDALADENLLCVAVDNSENDRVYPQKADFTFYGGLYRGVNLITVPAAHFALIKDGTPGIHVTPQLSSDLHAAEVTVDAWVEGEAQETGNVKFTLCGKTQDAAIVDGHAQTVFRLDPVHLWDGVNDPYLYTVTAVLDSGDEISARFGCRSFAIDPKKGFFLNGRSYPLCGAALPKLVTQHPCLEIRDFIQSLRDHGWPPFPICKPLPRIAQFIRSADCPQRPPQHRGHRPPQPVRAYAR